MPVITLPLNFTNSFWSQDYRRGLEVLFNKLEQGLAEDEEIVNFIRARIVAEKNIAASLTNPQLTGPRGTGFGADDGASLLVTFLGLKHESAVQGEAHKALAKELEDLVMEPFRDWTNQHAKRIRETKESLLNGWLRAYEQAVADVAKLQSQYEAKVRKADEAEDDAKFAPNSELAEDHFTVSSPRLNAQQRVVNRTPSVSERIAERLKALRSNNSNDSEKSQEVIFNTTEHKEKEDTDVEKTPKLDKGKGKATDDTVASPLAMSPPPMSPQLPPPKLQAPQVSVTPVPVRPASPILVAGISMTPGAISDLLRKAQSELDLRPVRIPIVGEYQDCFTGEEFVTWLKNNVEAFGSSVDHAEEAARDLTEDEGLLRRIGEFGNSFEASEDAFYQFRPKAFTLAQDRSRSPQPTILSPEKVQPVAENLIKRSNTLANFVVRTIKNQTANGQPPHIRARAEAQDADEAYRLGVRRLDAQRLSLEDTIEATLKTLQRWESDRLRAVKTVLLQYHGTLATLSSSLQPSIERSSTLIQAFQPESDLTALMERYRTGPFRPTAPVYESITHDVVDSAFGLDLRKWAGHGGWATIRTDDDKKKDTIPPILAGLLSALNSAYDKLEKDDEKRRTWIYEVPLPMVHGLRQAINNLPMDEPIPETFFDKCDAPLLAATLKLWLLETNPPVAMWEGWDDIKKLYPNVGATTDVPESQHVEQLQSALLKFPKVHLYVLDAIMKHLKQLVDSSTKAEEDTEVYLTKLALSVGRTLLRPKVETERTIQDRHPTLFFMDLLKHYNAVLPSTVEKKKRESEKPLPTRKRTALVDQRINRRSGDARGLLGVRELQITQSLNKTGPQGAPRPAGGAAPGKSNNGASAVPPVPPVPPLPASVAAPAPVAAPVAAPPPPPPLNLEEKKDGGPPRPKFISPPNSPPPGGEAPVHISPPTPDRTKSPELPQPGTPDSASQTHAAGSTAVLTADEDKSISLAGANLNRSGSGEVSRVRGPRVVGGARGPRPPISATSSSFSGSAAAHVRGGSRTSISNIEALKARSPRPSSPGSGAGGASTPAADPNEYIPRKKGGKTAAGAFARRTMASGSEDELVDK